MKILTRALISLSAVITAEATVYAETTWQWWGIIIGINIAGAILIEALRIRASDHTKKN